MPPITLPPAARPTTAQPVRPSAARPVVASRPSQVLQSGREPAQLSLFGARARGAR